MSPLLPITDLAIWSGSALVLWLLLIVALVRLGWPAPALLGAPVAGCSRES